MMNCRIIECKRIFIQPQKIFKKESERKKSHLCGQFHVSPFNELNFDPLCVDYNLFFKVFDNNCEELKFTFIQYLEN